MTQILDTNLDTYEERYGELITVEKAAEILNISKKGLDSSIYGRAKSFEKFRRIRVKVGRRVYFPTRAFFEAILSTPA